MAIRQYIGARYVLKIYENSLDPQSADWEANTSYEPLTMVNYNNSSYISRKDVPANIGNPVDNPTYWALSGLYNGQIANLQNQIDTINNTDLPGLQNQIDTINNVELPAITDKTDLIEHSILFIGNSYVNFGVSDELADCFVNSYSKTTGGNGFATYTAHATTFEDELNAAIADTSIPKDDITTIVFLSAWGDTRAYEEGATTYKNALNASLLSMKAKINNNFPNIHRICVSLGESRAIPYITSDSKYNTPFIIHRLFKSVMPVYGFEYLGWSGFAAMLNGSMFNSDNIHPNSGGAYLIGNWLKQSYFGNAEYQVLEGRTSNVAIAYSANTKTTILSEVSPDKCVLRVRRLDSSNGDTVTLTANSVLIDLSTLSVPLPAPAYYDIEMGADVLIQGGSAQDHLYITLNGDTTTGIAQIYNYGAPTAATVGANKLFIPCLDNVVY